MAALVLFGVLCIMALLGTPIALGMGVASLVTVWYCGLDPLVLPSIISGGITKTTLMAVPFFIFLGNVMNEGGITDRIFTWCEALVGHIKGGLAQVNVLSSVVFAGISGNAISDAAGLGMVEIKAMREKGYEAEFSIGITVASSLLGPIIPPSMVLLVYASISEQSPGKLFIAGLLPGLFLAAFLMIEVYILCAKGKVKCPPPEPFSAKRLWQATKRSFFALLCPIILVLGITTGFATATEIGIIGCVYSIFVSIIYRTFTWKGLIKNLKDTLYSSASIMFLIGIGTTLSWVLTMKRVPQAITAALMGVIDSKFAIIIFAMLMILFLGCFMDGTSIQLIMVPLLIPLAKVYGIDLIHLGLIVGLGVTIGACTPPVGNCLFILASVTGEPMTKVVRGTKRFYFAILISYVVIALVPQISTWLPSILG